MKLGLVGFESSTQTHHECQKVEGKCLKYLKHQNFHILLENSFENINLPTNTTYIAIYLSLFFDLDWRVLNDSESEYNEENRAN